MTELRDAFFYTLLDKAKKDKNVILLTADAGAFALKDFEEQLPNQIFNVGIAEQNMVSVAAGMASKGKQVYCYAISSFLVLRAFEQIKIDVCDMNSNVILVGVGAGMEYSYDGSTHHCPNDIGVLRTLPNMKIYAPFDEETIKACMEISGPAYLRLPKGHVENLPKKEIAPNFFKIREGKHGYVLTYGMMVHRMLRMLDTLRTKNIGLVAPLQLKPLFDQSVLNEDDVMVVEQHSIHGGLLSAFSEQCASPERYFGYSDTFVDVGGSAEYIENEAGLDYEKLAKQLMEMDNGK